MNAARTLLKSLGAAAVLDLACVLAVIGVVAVM